MKRQYCVYTRDGNFLDVLDWIKENKIECEAHLNRTRFWIPEGPQLTWFLINWADVCPAVDKDEDYLTGKIYG